VTGVAAIEAMSAARLRRVRAMIIDMDGTLVLGSADGGGHEALPGAAQLIALLHKRGIPFRIFTNGTAQVPSAYAACLRAAGLEVHDAEMMTPAIAAADWFLRRGIRRVRALGLQGVQQPLRAAGLEVVEPSEAAGGVEAVFTGWFREFTFQDLEAACRDVWAGALPTTASNVPFFATQGGRAIGASFAINAMIKALTGKKSKVLGKPSRDALRCALRLMRLPAVAARDTVVIGDDPGLEVRMARAAGAMAIAVTTGLVERDSLISRPTAEQADIVVDSLGPIVEALG
jgi:HAD superfamily hydrolase (TIGR01450 family)